MLLTTIFLSLCTTASTGEWLSGRYPSPREPKEWIQTEFPVDQTDYFWQPILVFAVPNPERDFPRIQSALDTLLGKFSEKGLVVYGYSGGDKARTSAITSSGPLSKIPIATGENFHVAKLVGARGEPRAFLLGLLGTIVWEGSLQDIDPELERRLERELKDALPWSKVEKVPLDAEKAMDLVQKRRFKEGLTNLGKLLAKSNYPKEQAQWVHECVDHQIEHTAQIAKRLTDRGEILKAVHLVSGMKERLNFESKHFDYGRRTKKLADVDPLSRALKEKDPEIAIRWIYSEMSFRAEEKFRARQFKEGLKLLGQAKMKNKGLTKAAETFFEYREIAARIEEVESW